MEQEYLIGVTNKFAALVDDEDPYEIIRNLEAEKQKKKALAAVANNENKENKLKDGGDTKNKNAVRKQAPKPIDRVLVADRNTKSDNQIERNNKRNRDERPSGIDRNSDAPRQGSQRDGNKLESGPPRGPRPDGNRGEKRDGPRPFRGDPDSRPPRGPRQDGDSRPPRVDRQGFDEVRPARKERREFSDGVDSDSRPDRRPTGTRGRGPRPQGPGRNYDNRGKREFDRKSGSDRTGVKAVDKRDGAGPYNWDSNKDIAALAANDLNVTSQSEEQTDWEDSPIKDTDNAERKETTVLTDGSLDDTPPAAETDEPKELTLDEYRALRGKRERPQFDIRKPGEGEDLTQWKDMFEMKKKSSEEMDPDDDLEVQDYPQRVGRQRHVVGIDITFNDTFRGRGRGRGVPTGGRGRGGRDGRENRRDDRKDIDRGGRQSAPKVDDEKDFPSLG